VNLGGLEAAGQEAIGQGHDLGAGELLVLDHPPGPPAQADESDANSVVGARPAASAQHAGGQQKRRGGAQEFSAAHGKVSGPPLYARSAPRVQ